MNHIPILLKVSPLFASAYVQVRPDVHLAPGIQPCYAATPQLTLDINHLRLEEWGPSLRKRGGKRGLVSSSTDSKRAKKTTCTSLHLTTSLHGI